LALVTVVASVLGRERQSFSIDVFGDLLLPVLLLWMIVRIARQRSLSARAIYTGIWAILFGLAAYAALATEQPISGSTGEAALFALLAIVQLISLWVPSSSEWLSQAPPAPASRAL
jgi:uncharacterized membrane protein YcaP (DUF421 family)